MTPAAHGGIVPQKRSRTMGTIGTRAAIRALSGLGCTPENLLRHVRIDPYLPGRGPRFDLVTWDTGGRYRTGQWKIGAALFVDGAEVPAFVSTEIGVAPSDPIDSLRATRGALGWFALRPGDTDEDYFAEYTDYQMDLARSHGEALSMHAMDERPNPVRSIARGPL